MSLSALPTGCSTDFVGVRHRDGSGLRGLGVMSSFRGCFGRVWVHVRVSWRYTLAVSLLQKVSSSMQHITEETFRILVNAGSVRKVTIQLAPWNGRDRWAVVLKLGMEEATIKSARTEVRTWASLDSLARWLKAQGCGVAELRVV